MENLVNMTRLFGGEYNGKRVLITGHTGFKGSWLALWLNMMGAEVAGFSLPAPTDPNHLDLVFPDMFGREGDVRDAAALVGFVSEFRPEIVFHLAAQSLVRASYTDPVETFSTNLLGTLHVFEACRRTPSVRAIVNVTSDKCYENREWVWGYRENDPMGGYDPYSASKGCAELLTASYRSSFFHPSAYGVTHGVLLASGRAGNVIGGGDWAADRLIPDLIRGAAENRPVQIRNPKATRPWQHVLEPLSGYLLLGWRLLEGRVDCAGGWNFGPDTASNLPVDTIVQLAAGCWNSVEAEYGSDTSGQHEAHLLMLDCSKANKLLHWRPVWDMDETIRTTIGWYRDFYTQNQVRTRDDIARFVARAREQRQVWAK